MALILKEVRLTNPYIKIARHPDKSYNFSDLMEEKGSKPPEKEKSKPFRFSLNNVRIENGSIDFSDEPERHKTYCQRIEHWHPPSVELSLTISKDTSSPILQPRLTVHPIPFRGRQSLLQIPVRALLTSILPILTFLTTSPMPP